MLKRICFSFLFSVALLFSNAQGNHKSFIVTDEIVKPDVQVIYADWCPHCNELLHNTLVDKALMNDISEKYTLKLINGESEEGRKKMIEYGINGFPTILVFDAGGHVAKTIQGYRTIPEFRADLSLPNAAIPVTSPETISNGVGNTFATNHVNAPAAAIPLLPEENNTIQIPGQSLTWRPFIACPAGQYESTPGVCSTCPAGSYCIGGNPAVATSCPAGTYNNSTGATSSIACTPCVAGTYSTVTGATSATTCTACPGGTSSSTVGASSSATCLACPAGRYCPSGSSTPVLCPSGTYCPANSSSFTFCPSGTYNTTAGATSIIFCTSCVAGTYSTTVGATSVTTCISCPGGTYSTTTGANSATTCLSCTAGFFCPTGSSSLTACPAGFYCPAGSNSPVACAAGTYSSTSNASSSTTCTACPAGTFSTTTAATTIAACQACPAGKYCPAGSGSAINCPAGSYCPANSSIPISCPVGNYCPAASSTATVCPGGSYCPAASAVPTLCPAGNYCPAGSSTPVVCPPGKYCPAGSTNFSEYNNVGIGTTTPDGSAVLELNSVEKGLLIPRLDSTQRASMLSPATGLMVYQTDKDAGLYYYNAGWKKMGTVLKKTESVNIPAVAAGTAYVITITVPGAETGSSVAASPDPVIPAELVIAYTRVSAANTVEIGLRNTTASVSVLKTVNFYITVIK